MYPLDELAFPVRKFSNELQIDIGQFIDTGLGKELIDPVNAGRLLALGDAATTGTIDLSADAETALYAINANYDTEYVPGRIIAPALRVREDFREVSRVYLQLADKAPWLLRDLFAVDEICDPAESIAVSGIPEDFADHPLLVSPQTQTLAGFHPKSPRIFSERDNNILTKPPKGVRRQWKQAAAVRWALHLSYFNAATEESTVKNVTRHYDLQLIKKK